MQFSTKQRMYLPFKRFLDIFCSGMAIIVFCWLFLFIALAIKLTSRGPVFFKQKRIGKNKSTFNILKFRTMKIEAPHDVPTHMLSDSQKYITAIGKLLRKTSLDEIPQAFNIFVGHMSIVGPRPALWNQDDLIAEREKYGANRMRPGLSGWAQCNGRDTLTIVNKAIMDGEYVQRFSFVMDTRIVFITAIQAFRGKGEQEGRKDNTNL